MIRFRLTFVFLAAMLAVVASRGQPGGFGTTAQPGPLAVTMLPAIDDENIVAELKLKDEQVKALVAHRQSIWDEAYTTAPTKFTEGAKARGEATDALLKKTLTEAQYKRLVQIAAQNVLSRGFGDPPSNITRVTATILRRHPELVTAFKLTDEQKKQVETPAKGTKDNPLGARSVTLSAEQRAAAKEFLGEAFAKRWVSKSDPRGNSAPAPVHFTLLNAKDVRADIGLTDEQAKELGGLREKWAKLSASRETDLSPKDANEQAKQLRAETEKLLAGLLKPDQVKRLKQIEFQSILIGFGRPTPAPDFALDRHYTKEVLVKELAITDAQSMKIKAAWDAFNAEAAKALESADTSATAEAKLKELAASRRKAADAALDATQREKFAELIGKPFTGSTRADRPDRPPFVDRPNTVSSTPANARRYATFGNHMEELAELAGNKAVQEELKLKPEQIKTATELRDEIAKIELPRFGPTTVEEYAKAYGERSKKVAEGVAKVLDKDQAARFREVMMQFRERPPAPAGPGGFATVRPVASAVSYPGVAAEVKLTDDQRMKMILGTPPADVLNADQKSAIGKMLGTAFKGEPVASGDRPFPTRPPFPTVSPLLRAALANKAALGEHLKLTEEQSKKLNAAVEAYQKALPSGGGFLSEELRQAIAEFDMAIEGFLTADQQKRVAQIAVQFSAATNFASALSAPDTAKALELTDEQRGKLTALAEDAIKIQTLISAEQVSDPDEKLALRLRDAADERMLAVLTAAQKAKWKELTGDSFPGIRKSIPRRGFGGPGGGGFGPGGGLGGGGFGGPLP